MEPLRCPLCESALQFPGGPHEAQQFMAVLADHFAKACPAIATPSALIPAHKRPKGH